MAASSKRSTNTEADVESWPPRPAEFFGEPEDWLSAPRIAKLAKRDIIRALEHLPYHCSMLAVDAGEATTTGTPKSVRVTGYLKTGAQVHLLVSTTVDLKRALTRLATTAGHLIEESKRRQSAKPIRQSPARVAEEETRRLAAVDALIEGLREFGGYSSVMYKRLPSLPVLAGAMNSAIEMKPGSVIYSQQFAEKFAESLTSYLRNESLLGLRFRGIIEHMDAGPWRHDFYIKLIQLVRTTPLVGATDEERAQLLGAVDRWARDTLFGGPNSDATWTPRVLWRQQSPDESAKSFFNREYASKPFNKRPFSDQILATDEAFYKALKAVTGNNKRAGKVGGNGDVETATSLKELFPTRRHLKALPTPGDAVAIIEQRRATARRTAQRQKKQPKP